MESKIILALSDLKAGAPSVRLTCPDKTVQKGTQTNEAPVKYLLKKYPAIRQILCLVTPAARESALKHFRQEIRAFAPLVSIEVIDAPDTGKLPDETIAKLTQALNPGDNVYLDSSGGSRYAVMGLLQIARILAFKGVNLRQVVYANISSGQNKTLDDVTDLYQSLDLIGGMQELADFGSVASLRGYFRQDTSADAAVILNLLNAIEKMTDAITLCRTVAVKKATAAYQEAMARTDSIQDPIMRELIGILREKFGKEVSIHWLINWCLDHRMLTQALSLYREWMPEYILRDSGLFTAVPELPAPPPKTTYQDHNVAILNWMMTLGQRPHEARPDISYTIQNLDKLLPAAGFAVTDVKRLQKISWDFQYILGMRNMILHCNEDSTMHERLRSTLCDMGYDTNFADMSVTDVLAHIRRALKRAAP